VNRDLPEWDKELKWVQLHTRAASSLAPFALDKAGGYLEKAKKLTKQRLYAYNFFSSDYKNWNKSYKKARQSIEQCQQDLLQY
jgi:hypothetical protein